MRRNILGLIWLGRVGILAFTGIVTLRAEKILRSSETEVAKEVIFDIEKSSTDIHSGKRIMILIANYRDTKRCAETLASIFENAQNPDLLRISIFDQVYMDQDEVACAIAYCKLVGKKKCRLAQLVWRQIHAADAKGPTHARYEAEKAIEDEEFCLAIDSHLVFVPNWDVLLLQQWEMTENPNAIITTYPKATDTMNDTSLLPLMCEAHIEAKADDAMIQYNAALLVKKFAKPKLISQIAGGFNFGNCSQIKEVRNDPFAHYLFHGEEYSRAARLWTRGYDFYAPSEHIVYHHYEPRKAVWERDWNTRFYIQQQSARRIRHALGLPVSTFDFDTTDIENFSLGTKRTFEQWRNFSAIDPLASFEDFKAAQFSTCDELKYVPC